MNNENFQRAVRDDLKEGHDAKDEQARLAATSKFVTEALKEAFDSKGHKKSYAEFHQSVKESSKELDSVTMNLAGFPKLHIVGVAGDNKGLVMVKDGAKIQKDGHYKEEDLMILSNDGKLASTIHRSKADSALHSQDTTRLDISTKAAVEAPVKTDAAPPVQQPSTDGKHHGHGNHHRHRNNSDSTPPTP